MNRFVFLVALLFPVGLFAGDPIPDIDITLDQSPGGIVGADQTGEDGTVIFTELKPGPCTLTLSHGGKEIVLGAKPKERIIIPGNSKGSMKPLLFELSPNYNSARLSKAPTMEARERQKVAKKSGVNAKNADVAAAESNQAKSRERASSASKAVVNTDPDDDGDGIPTRSADGVVDCVQLVEIIPLGKGQLQVKVTCQ